MRRFILASVLAAAAILIDSQSVSAQYIYGYPGGVAVANGGFVTPFNYGYSSAFANPWLGTRNYQMYGDAFGNQAARSYAYYPGWQMGAVRTYYTSPGYFIGPYYTGPIVQQRVQFFRP